MALYCRCRSQIIHNDLYIWNKSFQLDELNNLFSIYILHVDTYYCLKIVVVIVPYPKLRTKLAASADYSWLRWDPWRAIIGFGRLLGFFFIKSCTLILVNHILFITESWYTITFVICPDTSWRIRCCTDIFFILVSNTCKLVTIPLVTVRWLNIILFFSVQFLL